MAKQRLVCRNHRALAGARGCAFSARGDDGRMASHERECFGARAHAEAQMHRFPLDEEDETPASERSQLTEAEVLGLTPPDRAVRIQPGFVSPVVSRLFGAPARTFTEVPRARAPVIAHMVLDRMCTQTTEAQAGPGQLTVCIFRNPDLAAAGEREMLEERLRDPVIALQCHLPDNSQRNFEIFTTFAELN